jgi:hypothetical protein
MAWPWIALSLEVADGPALDNAAVDEGFLGAEFLDDGIAVAGGGWWGGDADACCRCHGCYR